MNSYLETGIAIILIFFIFSVVAYVIQELIAVNLKYRSKMLQYALEQLMDGGTNRSLAASLFDHPQLKRLKENSQKLPSYIPATNFALAIIDIVAEKGGKRTTDALADFKNGLLILQSSNNDLCKLLSSLSGTSKDIQQLQAAVEKWFNEYMERVSGWYKNKYRWITRIIAICIALIFNLNMVKIAQTIHNDPILKETLVSTAEKMIDQPAVVKNYYASKVDSAFKGIDQKYNTILKDTATKKMNVDSLKKAMDSEKYIAFKKYNTEQYRFASSLIKNISSDKLIFGWEGNPLKIVDEKSNKWRFVTFLEGSVMILGLFIGAVGISMGGPFWFEIMTKLVNVRRAGPKPKENS
ncbi:hypothetical protein [Pedobacter sp. ASV12]|uniref:hypothetical protein n=1 Tax=Pedobacter sp. ASV12 TaxID=2795120 RepID=UPI0018ECDA52|nr:hypothetical protein [Pedobacter sp. ASV12]